MNITLAYQILEVSENISEEQLKIKYKKLVLRHHPDRNKETDTTKKFIEISDAYKAILEYRKQPPVNQNYLYQPNYGGTTFATTSWTFTFTNG